jgi:hypothetical protein
MSNNLSLNGTSGKLKLYYTSTKNVVKSLLSSSIGNVLEWYEYTLYAYFATVISALFFPVSNPIHADDYV